MTQFDNREKAFENKFVKDEETTFKINARRNKLLGQWAAKLLGLSGEAADAYALEVIKADFQEVGDEDVFRKLKADLDKAGAGLSDHQIRREMEDQLIVAREQILGQS